MYPPPHPNSRARSLPVPSGNTPRGGERLEAYVEETLEDPTDGAKNRVSNNNNKKKILVPVASTSDDSEFWSFFVSSESIFNNKKKKIILTEKKKKFQYPLCGPPSSSKSYTNNFPVNFLSSRITCPPR